MSKLIPHLQGIPETMLWTLYNRASEAMRSDAVIKDPECIRLFHKIEYDYAKYFGKPDDSHGMRSQKFDDAVKSWIQKNPAGTVIELACGLETQFQRCDNGQVHWVCLDVAEALAVRECLLPETDRCTYLEYSALDTGWISEVSATDAVFVSAQGLFMYFEESEVQRLISEIVEAFPGVVLMFDTIPPWFSRKTLKGFGKTEHYRAPPMPWGIKRGEIDQCMRSWNGKVKHVDVSPYGFLRGFGALMLKLFSNAPLLRNIPPCIVRVHT